MNFDFIYVFYLKTYFDSLNKKEHIGLVLFDNVFREKVSMAINWLDRLRENKLILL